MLSMKMLQQRLQSLELCKNLTDITRPELKFVPFGSAYKAEKVGYKTLFLYPILYLLLRKKVEKRHFM